MSKQILYEIKESESILKCANSLHLTYCIFKYNGYDHNVKPTSKYLSDPRQTLQEGFYFI